MSLPSPPWIYIDSNEASVSAPDIARALSNRFEIKIQHLDSGDYLFGNNICVERKAGLNFYQDIINGHLFEQLEKMCSLYDKPMVLVEGMILNSLTEASSLGAIISLLFSWNRVKLWRTRDRSETKAFLKRIAVWAGPRGVVPPPRYIQKAKKPDEIRSHMLQCIKGIGPKTAKRVLLKYPTFEELLDCSPKDLKGAGLQSKLAYRLHRTLHEDVTQTNKRR